MSHSARRLASMAQLAALLLYVGTSEGVDCRAQQPAGVCRLSRRVLPPEEVTTSPGITRISAPRQPSMSSAEAATKLSPAPLLPAEETRASLPIALTPSKTPAVVHHAVDASAAPGEVQSAMLTAPQPVVHAPRPLAQPQPAASPSVRHDLERGVVQSIDLENQTVSISLPTRAVAQLSSRALVVHRYTLGRYQTVGEFEVIDAAPGTAVIRPVPGSSIRIIAVGDNVSVATESPAAF
ncbi:MAG: hypothetical protein U0872_13440 [Planctomycetaceae bacterium]